MVKNFLLLYSLVYKSVFSACVLYYIASERIRTFLHGKG